MDILLPYVDGSRPSWQAAFNASGGPGKCLKAGDTVESRYCEYGLFKYWWRAVETNYTDLNKVHLLVMDEDQVPGFLADDPRVVIHFHREFIPEKLRPCFNSSVIELCAMKNLELPGLYILSNDDMYANRTIDDGCLCRNGHPLTRISEMPGYQDTMFQGFLDNGRRIVSDYYGKPCPCYDWIHLWQVYDDKFCKKFLSDNWERVEPTMTRFREKCNVNHLMCMMAQNLGGISVDSPDFPATGYYRMADFRGRVAERSIMNRVICVNDTNGTGADTFSEYMSRRYPEPSSFETFDSIVSSEIAKYAVSGNVAGEQYSGPRKGILWIHWYYMPRRNDKASKCETFHMNMMLMFGVFRRVKGIRLRISGDVPDTCLALETFSKMAETNGCPIVVERVQNTLAWEHDTFRDAVEYAVETGEFVYYTHFKGVTHFRDQMMLKKARTKNGKLIAEEDLMYWCYLMYRGMFAVEPDTPAIGPLYRNGILCHYRFLDTSWSDTGTKNHYAGSFQAFDGVRLKERFAELGLDRETRFRKIWVDDRYTVEQFLSLVFRPNEVKSSIIGNMVSYKMHTNRKFGPYLRDFDNMSPGTPRWNSPIVANTAVLTYIFGSYETLKPVNPEPGITYVCVTDNPRLVQRGWTIIVDSLGWLSDARSRYHYVKLHPFEYVDAEQILVIDGSYYITGPVSDFIRQNNTGMALKPHPERGTIRKEIPQWTERRGMTSEEAKHFAGVIDIMGGTGNEQLYEFDYSVWNNREDVRRMGEMAWSILVSCADKADTFPSNQLVISLLAGTIYSGTAVKVTGAPSAKKYRHGAGIQEIMGSSV